MPTDQDRSRPSDSPVTRPRSRLAVAGFALAGLAALIAWLSGFGTQAGWWHFRTGFDLLTWAAYGGVVATALSFIGLVRAGPGRPRRGMGWALAGLLVGLTVLALPFSWQMMVRQVPPIHDLTTDTERPPAFRAILPRRQEAPNPADYGGPEIAAQQRAAYPDLQPLLLSQPPDLVFARALDVVHDLGWELVEADRAAGTIEATDTTFWFGFKDDVVIRITPIGDGTRVDVRSVSRVGRSDVGTNAQRIRTFLKHLQT